MCWCGSRMPEWLPTPSVGKTEYCVRIAVGVIVWFPPSSPWRTKLDVVMEEFPYDGRPAAKQALFMTARLTDRKCLLCQCNWCKVAKSGHYIIGQPRLGPAQLTGSSFYLAALSIRQAPTIPKFAYSVFTVGHCNWNNTEQTRELVGLCNPSHVPIGARSIYNATRHRKQTKTARAI